MKRIIGIVLFFLMTLGVEKVAARYRKVNTSPYTERAAQEKASPNRGVNCAECCREGRYTSSECAAQCNRCQISGSDESEQEAFDFPS